MFTRTSRAKGKPKQNIKSKKHKKNKPVHYSIPKKHIKIIKNENPKTTIFKGIYSLCVHPLSLSSLVKLYLVLLKS